MKLRIRILAAGMSSAFSLLPVQAQEVCVDLAKTIVYNTSRSFSLDEQRQINKADLCTEQYKKDGSSRSLQIEASYKFFSGGLSGTDNQIREEQSKQCEAKFGDYWSKSIRSTDARTASADSLSVINECVRLNSKGLTPRMTVANDGRDFTLALEWNSSPAVNLKIDHVGPRDFKDFKCNVSSPGGFKPVKSYGDVSTTINNGGSLTLACERPPTTRKVDGEDVTCYRDALISVATSGPTATIKVPQACTPSMPGKRAEAIEKRLKDAESTVQVLSDRLRQIDQDAQARLQGNSIRETVPTSRMVALRARCDPSNIACLAAVSRHCQEKGYQGGFPQEWNDTETIVVCTGKK